MTRQHSVGEAATWDDRGRLRDLEHHVLDLEARLAALEGDAPSAKKDAGLVEVSPKEEPPDE